MNKQAAQQEESTAIPFTTEELRAALAKVRDEELPETPEAKEQYFMGHVGMGEQLCAQGRSSWRHMCDFHLIQLL